MEYQLTAELASPPDAPDLDALQQVGVMSLLDNRLGSLALIEGPDGIEIIPMEHSVDTHLGGAVVSWLLDAPALVFAEDATRAVLEQIIDELDALVGWEVKHCAVTATDDQLENALAVSVDGPDGEALITVSDPDVGQDGLSETELSERRAGLLRAGEYFRAFDLTAFGDVPEEHARYVAGALMHGIEMLTDELFDDVQLLDDEDATAAEAEGLWALDELPPAYADRYTALFGKQFLVATSIVGHRLTRPDWTGPGSVAEALALRIAEARAEVELDFAEVLDPAQVQESLSVFEERIFDNADHELLYDVDESELGPDLAFEEWFTPREQPGQSPALHPYLADEGT